jgi:hypothetical protein
MYIQYIQGLYVELLHGKHSWLRNSQSFMVHMHSLPYSQEPNIDPHPESDESSPTKSYFCTNHYSVGSEFCIQVAMQNSIFWDITPYSPVKIDRRFRRWRRYVPPKHWLTFTGLHGVILHKKQRFSRFHSRISYTLLGENHVLTNLPE